MAETTRDRSSKLFMNFGESAAPPESSVPAASADLGKLLCATRMRLGKDLQRIADVLHIRYNFLVAIEDGRYEDSPGQAYAIGFVRAYADHLGLDGDEIVRRYKEESAGLKHKSAFEFQIPASDSALPSGTLLLIAEVAGMVNYGAWY
jgi:cytoskeletal protein RodZ